MRLGLALTTLHIDGQQQSQPDKEQNSCGTNGQALIARREPGDQSIAQWAHNAGQSNGKCPQAKKLSQSMAWNEQARHGPASGLARTHANTRQGSRPPKNFFAGGQRCQNTGDAPPHQSDRQRQFVTDAILHIPKHQGAKQGRNVQYKNEDHGFLRLKSNDLFGVNGSQSNGHSHAALIGHCTRHELHEIFIGFGFFKCLTQLLPPTTRLHACELWCGVLFHECKGDARSQRVNECCDKHGDGHELSSRLSLPLRPKHVGQTYSQSQHAAQITPGPSPCTDSSHGLGRGQFRQKRSC